LRRCPSSLRPFPPPKRNSFADVRPLPLTEESLDALAYIRQRLMRGSIGYLKGCYGHGNSVRRAFIHGALGFWKALGEGVKISGLYFQF
jgi:hypothetical protein